MDLVQIVPSLPPHVDGIGDYALQLARQLRQNHNLQTRFLVCNTAWEGNRSFEGFEIDRVEARTAEALVTALNRVGQHDGRALPILIHFGVYGYEKRGVPFWFVKGLEAFSATYKGQLNLCLHELEVTEAPVWSSGFWVPRFQINIIQRLSRLAHLRYTNTEYHRGKLERWRTGRFHFLPNFSTISEPLAFPEAPRRRDLVVFGRPAVREPVYSTCLPVLERLCTRFNVERIIDIGSPLLDSSLRTVGGATILRCGRLEESLVSGWMAASAFNFMFYPVQHLTKSSVLAVACAHGTITFVYDPREPEVSCPGLQTSVDFLPFKRDPGEISIDSVEGLSRQIFANYQDRASWAAAKRLSGWLRPIASIGDPRPATLR